MRQRWPASTRTAEPVRRGRMMRTGCRVILAGLASILVGSAPAISGPYDQRIGEILDEALSDWAAFLSCSLLEPETHAQIRSWWDDERRELEQLLARADLEAKLATGLQTRLMTERLMAPTAGDVTTLVAFCADTDWRRRVTRFGFPQAAEEIEQLLTP